jgi:hypothetical protein
MRSVYDAILNKIALDPVAASSVQTGGAIDTKGYNSCVFVIQNGVATGTPTSYTVDAKLQESDASGSGFADVTGYTITQITADSKIATLRVEGLGTSRKRYLKVLVTPAMTGGSSPKALIGSVCCLGRAYKLPVGNTP